ncbi:MAG: hypothetical protein ACI8U4_001179, partial [Natronomonas sp.]
RYGASLGSRLTLFAVRLFETLPAVASRYRSAPRTASGAFFKRPARRMLHQILV